MNAKEPAHLHMDRRVACKAIAAAMTTYVAGCSTTSGLTGTSRQADISLAPPRDDVELFVDQFGRQTRAYLPPFRGATSMVISVGSGQVASVRISHGYGLGDVSALMTQRLAQLSPSISTIREAELVAINEGALRASKRGKEGSADASSPDGVLVPDLHFQLTILEYLPDSNVVEKTRNAAGFGVSADANYSRSSADGRGLITFTLEATGPDRMVRQHMALVCKCRFDTRSLSGKNFSVSVGPLAGGVSESSRTFYGFTDAVDYTLTHMVATLLGRHLGMPVESFWAPMGRRVGECEWAQAYITKTRASAGNRQAYYSEVAFLRALSNGGQWPKQFDEATPALAFKQDAQGGSWSWTGGDGVTRRVAEHASVAELRRAGYLLNQSELEAVVLRAQLPRTSATHWVACWNKLAEVRQDLARAQAASLLGSSSPASNDKSGNAGQRRPGTDSTRQTKPLGQSRQQSLR